MSYGLKCIRQDTPLEELLIGFNHKKFKEKLKELPSNTRARCSIELSTYAGSYNFIISFSKTVSINNLSNHHVQFDTHIYYAMDMTLRVSKNILYVCSNSDNCERQFLFDHFEWFLEVQYLDLKTSILFLLKTTTNKAGQCLESISTSSPLCVNKTCQIIHSNIDNAFKQKCTINANIDHIVQINTIFNTLTQKEEQQITFNYECNNCHRQESFPNLQKCIYQYYDLSPIRKILGYNNDSDQQDEKDNVCPWLSVPTTSPSIITESRRTSTSTTTTTTKNMSLALPHITSRSNVLKYMLRYSGLCIFVTIYVNRIMRNDS